MNHFDRSNVFGCQGLQESAPDSRMKMIGYTLFHLLMIPFTLLFYPIFVLFSAYINPYYMPKELRCLCFCKAMNDKFCPFSKCSPCLWFLAFAPIIFCLGLLIGCANLAIFLVPAYIIKIYKLLKMSLCWRCFCCLNRHSK